MESETISEPEDIYAARHAAHSLIDAVYSLIATAMSAERLYDDHEFPEAIYLPDQDALAWGLAHGYCVRGESNPRNILAGFIEEYHKGIEGAAGTCLDGAGQVRSAR